MIMEKLSACETSSGRRIRKWERHDSLKLLLLVVFFFHFFYNKFKECNEGKSEQFSSACRHGLLLGWSRLLPLIRVIKNAATATNGPSRLILPLIRSASFDRYPLVCVPGSHLPLALLRLPLSSAASPSQLITI